MARSPTQAKRAFDQAQLTGGDPLSGQASLAALLGPGPEPIYVFTHDV
ncbi:MAG TPA: hypothetical protein VN764_11490 [Polyangiaceae bacterium]|nr:hypothetical protein [Polyangiaceae bacterium]